MRTSNAPRSAAGLRAQLVETLTALLVLMRSFKLTGHTYPSMPNARYSDVLTSQSVHVGPTVIPNIDMHAGEPGRDKSVC